jgi:hypothetical protein
MLDLVNEALDVGQVSMSVSYRPHPTNAGQQVQLHPSIRINAGQSIHSALLESDVVVTGAMSSVSVEAVCSGRITFVVGDPHEFLTSPLDGAGNSLLVSSSRGLVEGLIRSAEAESSTSTRVNDVFTIDPTRNLWRTMLSVESAT